MLDAGLTSRPEQRSGAASRYSLAAQADLVLQLCAACGVAQVLLAGHSDGALLALMAAAAAARYANVTSTLHVAAAYPCTFICDCDFGSRICQPSSVVKGHA